MTEPDRVTADLGPIAPQPAHGADRVRRGKLTKLRGRLGVFGVLSALAALGTAGGAIYAAREGSLSYPVAHDILFALVAPALALLGAVLGLLTLVFALFVTPRQAFKRAIFAIVVGAGTAFGATQLAAPPVDAPPVREVATDWRDPLTASPKLLSLRGEKANPIELAPALTEGPQGGVLGRLVAEVNAKTCPAAVPATVLGTSDAAYAKAKTALTGQKLALVTDDPATGRLEATAERGLFAQKDDVIVRVRPEGAGARIDFRSVAREGATDGGANCARLTKLRAAVAG